MAVFARKEPLTVRPRPRTAADEDRVVRAEMRANALFEKAVLLHQVVGRRDQQNHWQESVNRLFQGGAP